MQIYRYPLINSWPEITRRPTSDFLDKIDTVSKVMAKIRTEGDSAIRKFTKQFDHADIHDFKVSEDEIDEAVKSLTPALKNAILIVIYSGEKEIRRVPIARHYGDREPEPIKV